MGLLNLVGDLIAPVTNLIDDMHTSDEEKMTLKQQMMTLQVALFQAIIGYEKNIIDNQGRIVEAEAKSEGWLTRSWRPIVMLTFTALIVCRWLGLTPDIPVEIEKELWATLKIAIGGYVGGRSLEKVLPVGIKAFKDINESKTK